MLITTLLFTSNSVLDVKKAFNLWHSDLFVKLYEKGILTTESGIVIIIIINGVFILLPLALVIGWFILQAIFNTTRCLPWCLSLAPFNCSDELLARICCGYLAVLVTSTEYQPCVQVTWLCLLTPGRKLQVMLDVVSLYASN